MEKVPHAQPVPSLKNGAAACRSRLKIATDMAGLLGSSEAPARTGRSFGLRRVDQVSCQKFRGLRRAHPPSGPRGEAAPSARLAPKLGEAEGEPE
jgi:hypothetical protein